MTMLPNLFKKIPTKKLRMLSMNKPITQEGDAILPPKGIG